MTTTALADAIRRILADPSPDAPLGRLAGLVVDTALDQRIDALLDADETADQLLAALSGPAPARVVADHLEPAFALERARAEASGETVGDAVPTAILAEVDARLERPIGLPDGTFDGVVEPADVRALLAAALADTVEDVLARLGLGGGAGGANSGLLGTLARGARAVRDTGSGLLGAAFGGALQEGVRRQIQTLAAQSAGALKDRIRDRLRSPEGREVERRVRRRVTERLLGLRLTDVYTAADDPGVTTGARWSLDVLAHNLARPAIRDAVREQVRAAIARVGDRSARTFLAEVALLDELRPALVAQTARQAGAVVVGDPFRDWLVDLLDRAGAGAAESSPTRPRKKTATKKTATKKTATKRSTTGKTTGKKTKEKGEG